MALTWLGIVVIAFLAVSCYIGYKRGFIKEVVSTLILLLTMGVVWVINPYVNEFIMDNTPIYATVHNGCKELVENATGGNIDVIDGTEQEGVIEGLSLPNFLKEDLEKNNTAPIYNYLSVNSFTDYVAEYLSRSVINGVSFIVSFIMATILLRILAYALDILSKLPIVNGVNKIAGAILGITKGLIFVWIAFLILTILCNTEIGKTGLEMIEKDKILGVLYEMDIFVKIFMNIF